MKNLGIKEQIFIAIGLAVLIVVLCAVFLWKPQFDRVSNAKTELQNLENQLAQKKSELQKLQQAKAEAPKVESESLSLSKSIPEEEDVPSLIVEIEQVATESNVKLLNLNFTAPQVNGSYSTMNFSSEVDGSYFNLADFFYEVSQMPRQVKVKSIDFSMGQNGYPILSTKVEFETYVYTTTPINPTGEVTATGSSTSGGATK
jgi:type IV pilus assembly protein PilO